MVSIFTAIIILNHSSDGLSNEQILKYLLPDHNSNLFEFEFTWKTFESNSSLNEIRLFRAEMKTIVKIRKSVLDLIWLNLKA